MVDDDEFNRFVLRRMLPQPPLTLAMAVNGRAALDAAAREWPDVVLLDLEMPVMDGYEAARQLRELERAGGRPRLLIVAISSNDDRATMERAIAAGCDDYLVKPASRAELLGILAQERVERPAERIPEESEAVLVDADLEGTLPGFLGSRIELLDEMRSALAGSERLAFKRLAHKLAGSLALYGFGWASAQCRALEAEAQSGEAAALEARRAAVRAHLEKVTVNFRRKESA